MALPAASVTPVFDVLLRPMVPLLAPVVPVVLTDTVHVVTGAVDVGVTDVMLGAVPATLLVASVKLLAVTPLTGSENVTVQLSGPALRAAAPTRTIEDVVGAVLSTV